MFTKTSISFLALSDFLTYRMELDPNDVTQMDPAILVDLRGIPLSRSTKERLLNIVHLPKVGYRFVMRKYNLNYNTLRGYHKKMRKHVCMKPAGGRPRKLDEISCNNIRNFVASTLNSNPSDVYKEIRLEYKNTNQRRYPTGLPLAFKERIAKNSVYRYYKLFMNNAQE